MNFTQQTELSHVFMSRTVSQWARWRRGHRVPTALLQQVLAVPSAAKWGRSHHSLSLPLRLCALLSQL